MWLTISWECENEQNDSLHTHPVIFLLSCAGTHDYYFEMDRVSACTGVVPMLAAPMPGSSDFMLSEAVRAAAARGLVEPDDHIVCLMSVRDDVVLKIVSVDSLGIGLKPASDQDKKPESELPALHILHSQILFSPHPPHQFSSLSLQLLYDERAEVIPA